MENELGIVDALPGLVWTALPDGHVDFFNRRWLGYTGLSVHEARNDGWHTTVHSDDLPAWIERWQRVVRSGETFEVEARLRRFDGEYRWFLVRATPWTDDAGRVVRWCGSNTDIDHLKGSETLLAGENGLLELVASARPLSEVLDALCRLLDETAEGCSSSVLLLDRTRKRVRQVVAPSLPSSYGQFLVTHALTRDGGPCGRAVALGEQVVVSDVAEDARWLSTGWLSAMLAHGLKACWSTPIRSLSGPPLGSLAIYRTSSGGPTHLHQTLIQRLTQIASIAIERAHTDGELERSAAFLAEAQRLSSTGSFSWRVESDEYTWSEELYRIYGFEPGVPVTHELIGTRDSQWAKERTEWLRNDTQQFEDDYQLQMADGTIKHLHFTARVGRDQHGRLEYLGAVQDVTERRRSEEALHMARSELAHVSRVTSLGELTASIAHEVNQPLSGIVTNASTCLRMLAAEPPNIVGACDTARRTLRDASRARDVTTRLRALFGKKDAVHEPVDLNGVAREAIALLSTELRKGRAMLRLELADDLPSIGGDRVQLQQVIVNLVLNASEAMSRIDAHLRRLEVRTAKDSGEYVRLTVTDTGIGFDPQHLDKLFGAFFSTKSGGMGVGLSVSRTIIESHQGRLWAASNEGPGATFSFSLPCLRRGATTGESEARLTASQRG